MTEKNKLLTFSPINDLDYDIDEVDHLMYMFSHECVGCVVLTLSDEISKTGKVYLDNEEYSSWNLIRTNNFPHQLLVVKLRGVLREYDTKVDLRIEDFVAIDGRKMEPQSFKINVLPRRNEYLELLLDSDAEDIFTDKEMIQTAEVFLENNLNVSETSRNLFLHRNTLTYRLDKIERQSGLDIRKFSDAVTFRLITVLFKQGRR